MQKHNKQLINMPRSMLQMAWNWVLSLPRLGAMPMQGAENVQLPGVQLGVASPHPMTVSAS